MTRQLSYDVVATCARWIAIVGLAACAGAPPQPTTPPPADVDEPVAAPIVIPVHAEASYVALRKGDPRLDRACEEVAFVVAHGGEAALGLTTSILRMHGIAEPPQRVVAGATTDDLDKQFGEDALRPNAVIGHGLAESTAVEILVFLPNMRLEPVPRAATEGVDLGFELDEPLSAPQVTVSDAGSAQKLETTASDRGFHVRVPCGTTPSQRYVSIEATDPRTPSKPLLIFPLSCGLPAPASLNAEPKSNLAGLTEARLVAILDRERASSHLPPLHRDARVAAAARAYVEDRAAGREPDPETILKRASLPAAATAWTTLHVDSLESALDRIVNDPAELAKLRDPARTGIGLATRRVDDGWWVSVIYITIPAAIIPDREAAQIGKQIAATVEHTSRELYADVVAERYANDLALGWSNEPLRVRALADLNLHKGGGGAQVIVDRRTELHALDVPALVANRRFKYFGVGVAQSARDGALTGAIWIVVLLY